MKDATDKWTALLTGLKGKSLKWIVTLNHIERDGKCIISNREGPVYPAPIYATNPIKSERHVIVGLCSPGGDPGKYFDAVPRTGFPAAANDDKWLRTLRGQDVVTLSGTIGSISSNDYASSYGTPVSPLRYPSDGRHHEWNRRARGR